MKNVLANTQYSKIGKHDRRNKHAAKNTEKQSVTSDYPSNNKKPKVLQQVSTNANSKTKRKQQTKVSTKTESKTKRNKGNKTQDTNSNQVNNDATVAIKKDKKVMPKELKETNDSRLNKMKKKDKNLKPTEDKMNLNLSNTKKKRLNKKKMKQAIKQIRASPEVEEKNSVKIVKLNENEVNFNQLKEMLAKPHKKQRTSSLPLRDRMMAHLKSSRFRFINETLYKNHSSKSKQYFKEDPGDFQAYHEGYKQQVQQWPVNPLDVIISSIKNMYYIFLFLKIVFPDLYVIHTIVV